MHLDLFSPTPTFYDANRAIEQQTDDFVMLTKIMKRMFFGDPFFVWKLLKMKLKIIKQVMGIIKYWLR